jgi:hypothetical protein
LAKFCDVPLRLFGSCGCSLVTGDAGAGRMVRRRSVTESKEEKNYYFKFTKIVFGAKLILSY